MILASGKYSMNSPKHAYNEMLDLRLRRGLKKWLGQKHPPLHSRERLLEAAAENVLPRASLLAYWLSISWNREYSSQSFERLAKATAYSLQVGVLIL